MASRILILGATSAIAEATARNLVDGDSVFHLVARHPDRLNAVAADLNVRGAAAVSTACHDLADASGHAALIAAARQALGGSIDLALLAYGTLGDHQTMIQDYSAAADNLQVNLLSPISLLMSLAEVMTAQQHGTIAVLSSVAGDRGRQSNYVYGTAKGGLSIFLSGLRGRLRTSGVRVITIKPGLVESPMTAGLRRSPLMLPAAPVGAAIADAIRRGVPCVYVPWFWRPIMTVVRMLPEWLFMRLKF